MKDKYVFKPIKPKRKSFIFSLPEEIDQKINGLAEKNHRTRSDIISEAVIVYEKYCDGLKK